MFSLYLFCMHIPSLLWPDYPICLISFAAVLGEKVNYKISTTYMNFVYVTAQKTVAVRAQDVP